MKRPIDIQRLMLGPIRTKRERAEAIKAGAKIVTGAELGRMLDASGWQVGEVRASVIMASEPKRKKTTRGGRRA